MNKNILLAIVLGLMITLPANASVMKAKAIDEISTTNPKEYVSVKLTRSFNLDEETTLKKGYILTGKMEKIQHPQEWHHNASFTFIPTSYKDNNGQEHKITKEVKATYRQKLQPDYQHSEITAGAITFSPSYINDTRRIIDGEGKQVFEDYENRTTPWGKGIEIDIKPNETIYFNFPD